MAIGDVSVTLNPAFYILRDTNGRDFYGPYDTVEEAVAIRPHLGNRVAADSEPLGVLKTSQRKSRPGRKPGSKPAAESNGSPSDSAPSVPASQAPKAQAPATAKR